MKVHLKCHKYFKGKNYIKTNSFVGINSQLINWDNSLEENSEKESYISHYYGKNSIGNTLSKMSTFANCNFKQIKTFIFSSNTQSKNDCNRSFFIHSLLKESDIVAFRLKKCIYCLPQVGQVASLKLRNVSKSFTHILTLYTKLLLVAKLLKNFEAM